MVNIKNGSRQRINFKTAPEAEWKTVWSTSQNGILSWKLAANELRCRNYRGSICLTAEYSGVDKPLEGEDAAVLIKQDIAYWNSL